MSKPPKMVLEGANLDYSRAVLFTDKDDVDLFFKIYTGRCEKRLIYA